MLRCQYVSLLWVQHLRELRLTDVLTHGEVADIISKYGNNWFVFTAQRSSGCQFLPLCGSQTTLSLHRSLSALAGTWIVKLVAVCD